MGDLNSASTPGGGDPEVKPWLPLSTLEVLGEHLYAKVREVQDAVAGVLDVAKVTGVLLELGEKQVLRLLQDEALLRQAVSHVLQHVPAVTSPSPSHPLRDGDAAAAALPEEEKKEEEEEELQERLYRQVYSLEPSLAPHLTGMLLELPSPQIRSLLQSHSQLCQAIRHAKTAYTSPSSLHTSPSSLHSSPGAQRSSPGAQRSSPGAQRSSHIRGPSSERKEGRREEMGEEGRGGGEEEEEMGERVYAEAERLYPRYAGKLTGMVLDMRKERVRSLLEDPPLLHHALHTAFTSLSPSLPSS